MQEELFLLWPVPLEKTVLILNNTMRRKEMKGNLIWKQS